MTSTQRADSARAVQGGEAGNDSKAFSRALVLDVGERYPVGERMVTVTPHLAEAVVRARKVLIDVAAHREVITYGELSEAIDGLVLPRHMGSRLHMLGHDCRLRDEPLLRALVVSAATGEVGTSDSASACPSRRARLVRSRA